jgi:hypothetical protein
VESHVGCGRSSFDIYLVGRLFSNWLAEGVGFEPTVPR